MDSVSRAQRQLTLKGWLTSAWLIQYIRERGGVMTVSVDLVVD